jgi:phosphoribosylformylglycinamidine synthase PurS subunit
MKARVYVVLKEGILDPQGKAVQQSLHALGFEGVKEVRVGKFFEIVLAAVSRDQADMAIRAMCDKLLSNPIIDNYRYEIIE